MWKENESEATNSATSMSMAGKLINNYRVYHTKTSHILYFFIKIFKILPFLKCLWGSKHKKEKLYKSFQVMKMRGKNKGENLRKDWQIKKFCGKSFHFL